MLITCWGDHASSGAAVGKVTFIFQRRRCGRCWHTTARLQSPSTAPRFRNRTSWGSTTAPRRSSFGPSCRGRSSANRKWFTTARGPVSLTQKVSIILVWMLLCGCWGGTWRKGRVRGSNPQWWDWSWLQYSVLVQGSPTPSRGPVPGHKERIK